METRIEKMMPEDLEQLQELYRELVPGGCPLATMRGYYEETCHRPDYLLLVAKDGGTVLGSAIGIVCIALDTPFLVVENVVVRKESRGMGVGRAMFGELDRFARAENCGYAMLASSGYRTDAHKFYEAIGFDDDVRGFRKYYK